MKKINAWEHETTVNGKEYTLILIETAQSYDAYICTDDYPFEYMFGLPKEEYSVTSAMETATLNAPDYVQVFEEE